jgi:hypothetical protein
MAFRLAVVFALALLVLAPAMFAWRGGMVVSEGPRPDAVAVYRVGSIVPGAQKPAERAPDQPKRKESGKRAVA